MELNSLGNFTHQKSTNKRFNKYIWIFFGFILLMGTMIIPTPYYLYQPGSAEGLSSKVTVENGHKSEEGEFYLTTILSMKANVLNLLYGLFAPNTEIKKEVDVRGDLNDEEYELIITHMMNTSQLNAIATGYKAAGEAVSIQPAGVFVSNIVPDSKAKGLLKVGDIIHAIDEKTVKNAEDFRNELAKSNKKVGDSVSIGFSRKGKEMTKEIELIQLDSQSEIAALGIFPEDKIKIESQRKVTFHTEDIGGPSAGLMFSLEIYSQLDNSDLKKGYKIAGTGTINLNGEVGQIGGISDKIIAAHNEGIEIFFCPVDIEPTDSNEKEVIAEAKKQGYDDIKIVPVKTMQDALDYLVKLEPKI
jgi:Lon-like protease